MIRLGIRENLGQFSLLVLINAFVGAMVGLERSTLPLLAESFGLQAHTAVLSFIAAFGVAKAATNYLAGRFSDRVGRKPVLVTGWLLAAPVPFLLMWAPSWAWVVAANVLLGASQGLAWSSTVIMKIDLAGPDQRGLAMGLNEFAGYLAVGGSALAVGYAASVWGLGTEPYALGVGYVVAGLGLTLFARETWDHVQHEASGTEERVGVLMRTTFTDRELSSVSQAGLVNNLNDGLAWGLFPVVHAGAGMELVQIGWLAAIYPTVWGLGQLVTGAVSDVVGRKPFIVGGMVVQAVAIGLVAVSSSFLGFAGAAALLGVGTAMVYPTLLAAIGDVAHPSWRASAVGVYRLWRDSGYVAGALIAGLVADLVGLDAAVWTVAALTVGSGLVVQLRMRETLVGSTSSARPAS